MSTAAILIIGDEILNGRFTDENGPYLLRRLRELGVRVRRLSTIPDDEVVIAQEILRLRAEVDWVFTSGGIGPTPDDLTFSAISKALGRSLERRPELVAILSKRLGAGLDDSVLGMAEIPEGAALWWGGEIAWPVVVVDRLVVLPGVPGLFRAKFESIAGRFQGAPITSLELKSEERETTLCPLMLQAVACFPEVHIGSYPRFSFAGSSTSLRSSEVLIVMEGDDAARVEACRDFFEVGLEALRTLRRGAGEP